MESYIKGSTGLYALIGSPVGHSGSPAMYNYCFRKAGLDYTYLAFDIKEDQVADAIEAFKLLNVRGFNVTYPCKTEVAARCDELSPGARIIGACNTVVIKDGRLTGHMTDGRGFVDNLLDHGVDVKGKNIVLLGSGGAALAIYVECALSGAASISIYSRGNARFEKAEIITERLRGEGVATELKGAYLSDQERLENDVKNADILVNATSVGMKPMEDATLIEDIFWFHPELVVADIVYNPQETRLMRDAAKAGVKCIVPGEGMLLWQGAAAYELYTGLKMPVKEYKAYKSELAASAGSSPA